MPASQINSEQYLQKRSVSHGRIQKNFFLKKRLFLPAIPSERNLLNLRRLNPLTLHMLLLKRFYIIFPKAASPFQLKENRLYMSPEGVQARMELMYCLKVVLTDCSIVIMLSIRQVILRSIEI